MAVVGNLEMVVATKAQLQKAFEGAGFLGAIDDEEQGLSVWGELERANLLQSVRVEVDLAIAVDFTHD